MVKKKENIVIKPEIEDISFKSSNIKEDVVLRSPKTPTIIEQMIESELPWDVEEQTAYIIERKTDTQFLHYENDVILNKLTKPTNLTPELYTLSSDSISEVYNPLEQNIGNYFKLKQLISYDYKNPTFNEINNYPGVDLNYNGEQIVKNLKNLMENCVDKIIEAYPNFILMSAYRSLTLNRMIGGSHDNSNHISGCAIDFKISEEHTSYVFNWCVKNLPEFHELMWAYPERGNKSWIHISYKKGQNIKRTTLASEREDIHKSYGKYRRGYKQEYQEGIVEAIQNLV